MATGVRVYGSADEATEVLRDAIEAGGDTLEVTLRLPARTAEKILMLLEAEGASGAVVIPVKDLYSTTEAAAMLGVSRPTLMKLLGAGELEAEMVGTHHRIPAEEIVAYQRARQVSRDRSTEAMSEFTSRVGAPQRSNVTFRRRAEGSR